MADEMEKNKISHEEGEVQDEGSEAGNSQQVEQQVEYFNTLKPAPKRQITPPASRSRSPRGPRRPGMIPIMKINDVRFCHQCGHFVGFGMRTECNAVWIDPPHAGSKAIMDQDRHGRHRTHSTPPSSKMGGWRGRGGTAACVACCSRLQ